MRKKSSRFIALAAVLAAFQVAFMALACFVPTGQLGFLGVASLFGVAAVVELGTAGGALVYAACAILGFLVLPSKTLAGLYAVFFGPYPVVKALAEPRKRWTEWITKLLFFNAALTVAIFALKMTVFDLFNIKFGVPLYYLGGNVVFVIFDIAVSRALTVYMSRIHTKIGKGK